MLRKLARIFIPLACLIAAGCHSPLKLNEITLQITKLEQTPAGLFLTLVYENSNATQLVITESRHELFLDGNPVVTVTDLKPVGFPMFASVTQRIRVADDTAAKILSIYAQRQTADYRIQSKCKVTIRTQEDTLRAGGHGTLSLEKK